MPGLGSGAWPFDPPSVDPRGILGPLVRVADREWDLGILRSTAILAGLLVALAAAASWRFRTWPRWAAVGLAAVVCAMLLVPAVLLQVGLRDATAPWYFTNDSTYQIEIAGDLVLDGDNPYGHDYGDSGLENFYPAADDEEAAFDRAARHHFAYFPGTALTAAAWRLLPRPWDDYRLFVLLATLALLPAALLFPGPLVVRLAVGSGLAANPLIVQGAWFGTADAPALLALVLSFALVTRGHPVWAGASLGAALALKQFALVALPFLAVMLLVARVPRRTLYQAGGSLRRGLPRHGAPVPDRRSRARSGTTPSPTAPTRTASSATGSRRSSSTSARSTTASATTRSCRSRSSSGCRSRRGSSGASGALGLPGRPLPAFRFRCSSCCS